MSSRDVESRSVTSTLRGGGTSSSSAAASAFTSTVVAQHVGTTTTRYRPTGSWGSANAPLTTSTERRVSKFVLASRPWIRIDHASDAGHSTGRRTVPVTSTRPTGGATSGSSATDV